MNNETHFNDADEIDLMAIFKALWVKRKLIVVATGVFSLASLSIILILPNQYTATTVFVTQQSEGKVNSNISNLASLAGVNLNSEQNNQISPNLFPKIVESTAYKQHLLHSPISFKVADGEKKTLVFKEYLAHYQKSFSLNPFKGKPNKDSLVSTEKRYLEISEEDFLLGEKLSTLLKVAVDSKEGFIALSATLSDPDVASQVTAIALKSLQSRIIEYKIENAKKNLDFIQEQYALKKKEFEAIQEKYALFKDQNKNISSALFENQRLEIETEYNLAFSLYRELAVQKEQAELQVNKDTPIFSVLQPITKPHKKSSPKRLFLLIILGFISFVAVCSFVIVVPKMKQFQEALKQ